MQHEKKNRYAHKYVNILQRTVGDHVKVTYTSCQRGRWGEIFSSGVKKLFVYFSNCCWLLLSFIRDATDEKEKGGETKTAILFSWPVMALEKDLDEISFFFLSLSYTLFCPWLGKEEIRYQGTDLIGAGHVTRDLGDSATGTEDPMPFVPWWIDSELRNLCTARSGRLVRWDLYTVVPYTPKQLRFFFLNYTLDDDDDDASLPRNFSMT